MKVIQKISLILLCLLSGSTLLSFVGQYSHLKRGEEEVFLLGDYHVKGTVDRKDRNKLLRYLAAAECYDKPIAFVLEGEEKQVVDFCNSRAKSSHAICSRDTLMLNAVRLLYKSFPKYFSHPHLHMVYADCRKPVLHDFYVSGVSDAHAAAFLDEYGHEEHFEEMQAIKNVAQKYLDKLDYEHAETYRDIQHCIINAASKNSDPFFCYKVLEAMIDINFYINVVQSLWDVDRVIFYAGAYHTRYVKERLLRLGFEEVDDQSYVFDKVMDHVKYKDGLDEAYIPKHNRMFNDSLLTADRLEAMFGCFLEKDEYFDVLFDGGLYKRPKNKLQEALIDVGTMVGFCAISYFCELLPAIGV